jgi:hypothetical protein
MLLSSKKPLPTMGSPKTIPGFRAKAKGIGMLFRNKTPSLRSWNTRYPPREYGRTQKKKSIHDFPKLANVSEFISFLGLITYYQNSPRT